MSEVLSQLEIDALVASLTMNAPVKKAGHKEQMPLAPLASEPKPYDFRELRRLPKRYLHTVFAVHEQFCRRFETILSRHRAGPVTLSIHSIEEQRTTDAIVPIEPSALSQSLILWPFPYQMTVTFEQHVVLSILDAMLGGRADGPIVKRTLTVLEEKLFHRVLAELPGLLTASWSGMTALEPELVSRQPASVMRDADRQHRASHVVIVLQAEVGQTTGSVQLTIPSKAISEVMETGTRHRGHERHTVKTDSQAHKPDDLMQNLADTDVELSAVIQNTNLSLAEVLRLRKGDIIGFGHKQDSVTMCVNGTPVFVGSPTEVQDHYGVRLSGAWKQGGAS